MTMHLVGPYMTTTNYKKRKAKKLTDKKLDELRIQWRRHNKDMRRKNLHSLQYENFEDYVSYVQGNPPKRNKKEKEFTPYAPSKPFVRDTEKYPSLSTSNTIPGYCPKKETPTYTGDLIVGIGTMHKSNLVPIMRGTKQAEELAKMRR
jgi:hypothetical protein